MRIRLNIEKSVHENAAEYYEEAKDAKNKLKGLEKAIEETKKEIKKAEKEEAAAGKKKAESVKIARKKEWYEKFHWFFTDSGKLVVGGRSADQNDLVYKKHFEQGDLFFHADIQGGAACILKDGDGAKENELNEVAQFAASFSNAWKNGNAAVDVYCVKKEQVSKHAVGGFIPKGAFAIVGERKWFRKTELRLRIGIENGIAVVISGNSKRQLEKEIIIIPGKMEKGDSVKKIAKILGVHPDDVQNVLPAGRISIKS
ncbi:DUF814 domain-containing protein [Candidatus Micrarchaeota archaeon]|nr:DUF814 domain-containing protein [Candidatus Micrarchaeota archaeon]